MSFQLYPYQSEMANQGCQILKDCRLVYIAAEVRCGKTHMALEACRLYGANKVLFVTKIKAFDSIGKDYKEGKYPFQIEIINRESIHKVEMVEPDVVVLDEAHGFGAYPKPAKSAKEVKAKYGSKPIIFMSGTPTPESYSQIYHQLWISNFSPFSPWATFYKWAHEFVKIYQRNMGYGLVNQYDRAYKEKIDPFFDPIKLSFTQSEAGFETKIMEQILYVPMRPITYQLIEQLEKDFVVKGREETIVADTGAKLLSKIHQLTSGTVIFDSGNAKTIDDSKAVFIKNRFEGVKIGIFFKFKQEYEMLKQVFGDSLTDNLEEFNSTDKSIALQYIAGREGISLRNAAYLVAFTPDYSATTYFQFRDRMTHKGRLQNEMFWVFAENSIEPEIYKKIMSKKKYTSNHYLKSRGITLPNENKKTV